METYQKSDADKELGMLEHYVLDAATAADEVQRMFEKATATRRRSYAPVARPRHIMKDRDVVVLNESLPSPAKKPRYEPTYSYHEERRQYSKPVFKSPEPSRRESAYPVKVIEKKPVLNTKAVDEWRALPQRTAPPRRKAVPVTSEPRKYDESTKPIVKVEKQKEVPISKEVKTVKEVSTAKEVKTVKEVPIAKEVKTVKEVPIAKQVKTVKEVPVVKEVTAAKEVKEETAAAKEVKEVTAAKEVKVAKEVPAATEIKIVKEVPATKDVKEVTAAKEVKVVKQVPAAKEVKEVKEVPAKKEVSSVKSAPIVKDGDKVKEKVKTKPAPTVKPNQHGLYELDKVTANVLQEELAQIMIKVWQELPDTPSTDAEEVVADRFRNAAGDDLQNAMGLSVTSRLLNIHNPLYAKLHFTCKPEAGCLQAFIKDYNISAFKRIGDFFRDNFAARFEDIKDFDKLCVHDHVKCGSAKVIITPCHKYLSCPSSIKSIYADNGKTKKHSKESSSKSSPQKKDCDKQKKASNAVKTDVAKAVDKDKTETDKITTPVTKTKTATDTAKANTQETQKSEKTNESIIKVTEPSKATPKKVESKKELEQKSIDKSKQVEYDLDDEMMVVDEMGEEDDEEMTDQDILALMSGGIVLDECSGSDDEN